MRAPRLSADQVRGGVSSPEMKKKTLYRIQPGVRERDKIYIYEQKRCEEKSRLEEQPTHEQGSGRVLTT